MLVGAEAVVENGGVINKLGTYQVGGHWGGVGVVGEGGELGMYQMGGRGEEAPLRGDCCVALCAPCLPACMPVYHAPCRSCA